MDTQTQIDRLIELAIVQRAELKKLVSELPQLREHLNAEIERVFESTEPQLRTELEDWTTKQAHDQTVKLGGELEAKIVALSKSLEATTQTRYNAIMAERAQNIDLAKKAEDKLAEVAQAIPVQVKQIVTDELARFPRAGEIDQLRKEFAEPRGLNPRGRWEPGATYYKLDLVAYNGDSYVANEETSEKPNRTSSKWTLNAARGQAGGGGFMSPAIGDYTASMITNVPAGVITSTNVQDAINELAADVDVSQNTLDALVTNADSVTITKGQVVYAFGSVGNRMSVKLALNTGDATSSKTIGVVLDSSIAAGATGNIRCVGVVDGLTLGSYTEGDVLYLGATAGSVTATKPYAPNHLVYVGIVERANNGNGELYVKIQNGYELNEIHDVQITSAPLAGALLMRDATNSLWKANRLTGTTNQVTVTNANTAVTLSLPTSLASVDSVTASASTALTLTGGSTGASLVLGQGASANAVVNVLSSSPVDPQSNAFRVAVGTNQLNLGINTNGNGYSFIQSVKTGAAWTPLVLQAGAGGNVLIGTTTDMTGSGGLKIAGTTAATTTTSGALIVAGGVGVSGAGYFGGAVSAGIGSSIGSATTVYRATNAGGDITSPFMVRNGSGTQFASHIYADTTVVAQGFDVWNGTRLIEVANIQTSGVTTTAGAEVGGLSFAVKPAGGPATVRMILEGAAGNLNLNSTTPASSSTVGALTIGNGTAATNVAIGAGKIWAGSTEASTGSTSGSGIFAGGIYAGAASVFGGAVTAGGDVIAANSVGITTGNITEVATAGTATLYANYNGYQQSNAQFRNFAVYDGKRAEIATFTGSTKGTAFAGAVTIAGTVIHTLSATPASASATGTVGTMSWDANYIYICTATNTWKRVAIATW